ncbi:MAG: hypothetical protein JNK76_08000, partial [Planctomycetales bacterium]|nr:hypothetical protein [Planctomycetales bacterium]
MRNFIVAVLALCMASASANWSHAAEPQPQRYELTARAGEIDSRAKPHPEIDFVFEQKGKPTDVQHAMVDTRAVPQGKLVIWLMG